MDKLQKLRSKITSARYPSTYKYGPEADAERNANVASALGNLVEAMCSIIQEQDRKMQEQDRKMQEQDRKIQEHELKIQEHEPVISYVSRSIP